MGVPMPFGLAKAGRVQRDRLPWLWAVNGAFSVAGSVVGVVIGIGWGITASMIAGLALYAAGAFYLATEHASPKSGA
jgi:fatty acid desaturase